MKAAKYAAILGKPKEEVWNNLDLCVKNSKGLLSGRSDTIALVLKGGKWKALFDEKTYWENIKEKWEEEDAKEKERDRIHKSQNAKMKEDNAEVNQLDKLIKEQDQEKYNKEKAENLGYTYKSREEKNEAITCLYNERRNGDDPFSGLKIAMWFIKQVGSIEKAEKLLQAAKLAIEAAKE